MANGSALKKVEYKICDREINMVGVVLKFLALERDFRNDLSLTSEGEASEQYCYDVAAIDRVTAMLQRKLGG